MKPNEQDGYSLHDGSFISASAIQTADRETQLDAMRTWFFQNFEDPAESTPYDGGYVYIDGGPYDAHDELNTEFGGVVSDDVIKELEKELQQVSWEWAGIGQGDEELFLGVSSDHFNVFGHSIMDILSVFAEPVELPSRKTINRLLYVNVVTALECYLSDFFTSKIKSDPALLRKYIESNDAFKDRQIPLTDVFKTMGAIEQIAAKNLSKVLWHRLKEAGNLYKKVLNVGFPTDTSKLGDVIKLRHELVHQNGKKEDGTVHEISEADVREAIKLAEELVGQIEARWMAIGHK